MDIKQMAYIASIVEGIKSKAEKRKLNDWEISTLGMAIGNLDIIADTPDEAKEVLAAIRWTCEERLRKYGDARVVIILGYVEEEEQKYM